MKLGFLCVNKAYGIVVAREFDGYHLLLPSPFQRFRYLK